MSTESKILREPTIDDIQRYKRGKKDNLILSDYWLCECWCGNYWVPSKHNYKNKRSCTCGKHSNDLRYIDETGHVYGELTVIKEVKNKPVKDKHKMWECLCSCGNSVVVRGKDLREHKQNSCGCIKSKGQKLIQKLLSENNIQYKHEYSFYDFVNENGNLYRFDWAIFKNGKLFCLLEYDGEQHFDTKNKWYRDGVDEIKNSYCKENNIQLFRISYVEYDKIDISFLKERINYEE